MGLELYQGLHRTRQGIRNLWVVGLYHLFEQQTFSLYRNALKWGYKGQVDMSKVEKSLKRQFNIEIGTFGAWEELDILRLVANCAKHSEGGSCAQLRDRRPEFFIRPEVDPHFVYPKTSQPLAGEGLFVTDRHVRRFVKCVKSFWADLGVAVRDL